jgi:hypothetical protein
LRILRIDEQHVEDLLFRSPIVNHPETLEFDT